MPSLPPAIHLAYSIEGEGPLVVGLHDLGRRGATMTAALEPLLDGHRLLIPDLRGHGDSPTPAGPWSVDDFASDVARLVAAEGGGAIVVGVGLGAATALALALGHPGLVSSMVLSGVGPKAEDQDGRDRWMLIARALRERQGLEGHALTAEAMATRPDWRGALAQVDAPVAIVAGEADRAVLVCGSGVGVAIVANKVEGVRAVNAHDPEEAEMSRRHNDANVLTLAGRRLDAAAAGPILSAFLATGFEGGRHARRIAKIAAVENGAEPQDDR